MSLAEKLVKKVGHDVVGSEIAPDDVKIIRQHVQQLLGREDVDVILTIGGTGIAPSDVTIEAVSPILEKIMPGFGELMRMLSYEAIGPATILSRSVAGVARGKLIFCLPGSPEAVRLALEEIVLRECLHAMLHVRERKIP